MKIGTEGQYAPLSLFLSATILYGTTVQQQSVPTPLGHGGNVTAKEVC